MGSAASRGGTAQSPSSPWMMLVEKLNGMESAAVDVEVNVPSVKIRSTSFPYHRLWMHSLDSLPNGLSDALTLNTNLHIEKCQFASMLISFNPKRSLDFQCYQPIYLTFVEDATS